VSLPDEDPIGYKSSFNPSHRLSLLSPLDFSSFGFGLFYSFVHSSLPSRYFLNSCYSFQCFDNS
jgi:hypothetical protein